MELAVNRHRGQAPPCPRRSGMPRNGGARGWCRDLRGGGVEGRFPATVATIGGTGSAAGSGDSCSRGRRRRCRSMAVARWSRRSNAGSSPRRRDVRTGARRRPPTDGEGVTPADHGKSSSCPAGRVPFRWFSTNAPGVRHRTDAAPSSSASGSIRSAGCSTSTTTGRWSASKRRASTAPREGETAVSGNAAGGNGRGRHRRDGS